MYRPVSNLFPRKIREAYKNLLGYSSIKIIPEKFIGFVILFSLGLAVALAFDFGAAFNFPFLLTFIVSFVVIEIAVYLWLLLSVDARAALIEKSLPDCLQLMASNLRAGLTTDKALLLSSRYEFGPLSEEINRVGKEVTAGKDIDIALMETTKRVRSEKYKKTIMLITSGLKSGGELAPLLEQTSRNLRNEEFVEEKIRSNVKMYVIFIFAAVGFGAPLLFGLSSFLVEIMTNLLATIEVPQVTTIDVPLSLTKITISPRFIKTYIITSLVMVSIFGSLIVGLISKGEEKNGIKFIPLLITVTLVIFFTVRFLISKLLGSLFNI